MCSSGLSPRVLCPAGACELDRNPADELAFKSNCSEIFFNDRRLDIHETTLHTIAIMTMTALKIATAVFPRIRLKRTLACGRMADELLRSSRRMPMMPAINKIEMAAKRVNRLLALSMYLYSFAGTEIIQRGAESWCVAMCI
jgi:hypothetical protein